MHLRRSSIEGLAFSSSVRRMPRKSESWVEYLGKDKAYFREIFFNNFIIVYDSVKIINHS
jgi:hypothetical protein